MLLDSDSARAPNVSDANVAATAPEENKTFVLVLKLAAFLVENLRTCGARL